MDAEPLSALEFCALEKALITGMVMRKKRHVEMGPVQSLKLALLDYVAERAPDSEAFAGALAEAVIAISAGPATGPAQAVASDLQMDWDLACHSAGFVAWLRGAATRTDRRATVDYGDVNQPG